ncbi:MAG: Type III pantothenate kinase [Candidatus Methanoperedenaceae archaeon GB37]|nr:MAG: Type III pantothenate kinase [Candidatus Methanoperedenaceae archaeon GB37]CAD7776971.1 Type III pantothenate kinase [Candidatus Methanoperedenaceae archaeon GB37]
MLLALDIGNLHTVLGLFSDGILKAVWRIRTQHDFTADELAIKIKSLCELHNYKFQEINHIAISCVVPPVLNALILLSKLYFHTKPFIISPGIKTGLSLHYDNPKELGADRIANAVAAYEKYHCSLIIIDFGTAITFEYISGKGEYKGGIIVPGIQIAAEALFFPCL